VTWYFPHDASPGDEIWEAIDHAIRECDQLILICSERSLNSWSVQAEIGRALQREERDRTSLLIPVRLDDYLLDGWNHHRKADVAKRVAIDFRKSSDYQLALVKLLRLAHKSSK